MGLFDGGLFDFNFDGQSSLSEQLYGTTLLYNTLNKKSDESDDYKYMSNYVHVEEDEDEAGNNRWP